jgi:hypothetical protein
LEKEGIKPQNRIQISQEKKKGMNRTIVHKILTVLMGWCLFASANAAHPALSGGDGTVSNPYQISKAQDLVDLSTYVNQQIESANTLTYYTITADIDMSGINFTPIGDLNTHMICCYINGNHKKISNLTISGKHINTGLIGCANLNSVFKNIDLENINYSINSNDIIIEIGGIVARAATLCTFDSCSVSGLIKMKSYSSADIGGICGYGLNRPQISDCINRTIIDIPFGYNTKPDTTCGIGGIVGQVKTKGNVLRCINYGNVTGPREIGGIVGSAQACTIKYNNNIGHITGYETNIGGIAGEGGSCAIAYNCNAGSITVPTNNLTAESNTKYIGGIVGTYAASVTQTQLYPVANNLNTGMVSGWNNVGGIGGELDGYIYNNMNGGTITDGGFSGCTSGSLAAGYRATDIGMDRDINLFYDKQISPHSDPLDGQVMKVDLKTPLIYRLYTYQTTGDSLKSRMNQGVGSLEGQAPLRDTIPHWFYNTESKTYPLPNNIDTDFGLVASAVIKLDTADNANNVNHQFKIITADYDKVTFSSASKGKRCRIKANSVGLAGLGNDTILISINGMTRQIPLVINTIDTLMFSGGKGTEDNPYVIANLDNLKELRKLVNSYTLEEDSSKNWSYDKYFLLYNNIAESFNGIVGLYGRQNHCFQGHFDGNGKTITLAIDTTAKGAALFAMATSNKCEIHDLEVKGTVRGGNNTAGICAYANKVRIDSCLNNANISSIGDTAGGICAIAIDAEFASDGNNGFVACNGISGGLTGYAQNCQYTNAVNGGSVTARLYAGGICGSGKSSSITTAVNYGYVGRTTQEIDGSHIDAICAQNNGSSISGTYFNLQMTDIHDSLYTVPGMTENDMLNSASFKSSLGRMWSTTSTAVYPTPTALSQFTSGLKMLNYPLQFKGYNTAKDICYAFNVMTPGFKPVIEAQEGKFGATDEGLVNPIKFGYDTLKVRYNEYEKIVPIFSSYGFLSGGLGTKDSPYLVNNEGDLIMLAVAVNSDYYAVDTVRNASIHKYFKQTTDITSTITNQIGNSQRIRYNFNGYYDGGGHSIAIAIKGNQGATGLFGAISQQGWIANLRVNGSVSGTDYTGGICGICTQQAKITACINAAKIKGNNFTGGICGGEKKASQISDVLNIGQIDGSAYVGGIAGETDSSDLRRAINTGIVTASGYVGGICGQYKWSGLSGMLIYDCMNLGYFKNNVQHSGALIGYRSNTETNVRNLIYDNQLCLNGAVDGADEQDYFYGLSTKEIIGKTLAEQKDENWTLSDNHYPELAALEGKESELAACPALFVNSETYANIGSEFTVVSDNKAITWTSTSNRLRIKDDSVLFVKAGIDTLTATINGFSKQIPMFIVNGLFSGGNGTKAHPYRITCKKDMDDLADYVNSNRLSLSSTDNWSYNKYFSLENDIPADSLINNIVGKTSENADQSASFRGNFEGNGHTMTLDINEPKGHNVGLFGLLENGGTINALKVMGKVTGEDYVGGICGYNSTGNINNCQNAATVTGYYYTGGICGYNKSTLTSNSNAGNITSENRAGGICGNNEGENASITGAVNIGSVQAEMYAGGIIGNCDGSNISATLNAGKVTADLNVGGIIGKSISSKIKECVNVGEINRTAYSHYSQHYLSAICGNDSTSAISESYYDTTRCNSYDVSDKSHNYLKGMSTSDLTSAAFANTFSSKLWTGTDGRYPRPQLDTIALLASSALSLGKDTTTCNISDEFTLNSYSGIGAKSINGRVKLDGNKATLLSMGNDTIDYYYNRMHNKIAIGITCITTRNKTQLTGCDSLLYGGNYYKQNASFTDRLKDKYGCDSVVSVSIVINKSQRKTQPEIYATDSTKYRNITYKNSITVIDTFTAKNGCDSIIVQPISILHPTIINNNLTPACDSLTYEGHTYKESTILSVPIKDANNRDSVITNTLITINHSAYTTQNISGIDSVKYGFLTIRKDTTIIDTLNTALGCDSVITTHIKVPKTSHVKAEIEGCNFLIDENTGVRYENDTTIYDTLTNKAKCDSVIELRIIVHHTVIDSIYHNNCYKVTYKGVTYTEDATIEEKYKTDIGCDSIVRHIIHPIKPSVHNVYIEGCRIVVFRGKEYYENTSIMDTLKGSAYTGCDSIIRTNIIVHQPNTHRIAIFGCGSVTYNSKDYEADTTLSDTLANQFGCDSVIITEIHAIKPKEETLVVSGCESVNYKGLTYKTGTKLTEIEYENYFADTSMAAAKISGIKYDESNSIRCQKTNRTVIIEIGTHEEHINQIDSCGEITFRGRTYKESIDIVDSFTSKTGCDSIIINRLAVHNPTIGHEYIKGCKVAYYDSKAYSRDTILTLHLTSKFGCDSTSIVNIHVSRPSETNINLSDCNLVTYEGEKYTRDTTLERSLINTGGCDSVVHVSIKVLHPSYNLITIDSMYQVIYNGRKYTRSTVLHDTLVNSEGCDSIIKVAIIIEKSLDYPIIVNKYNNYMLICNNNIGNDKYNSYQWYKNAEPVYGATKQYYEEDQKLNGCYQVYVTTTDGREYFSENVCIEEEKQMNLYPNPVSQGSNITIDYNFTDVQKKGLYIDIYNSEGVHVYSDYPRTFPIEIPIAWNSGYYFVLITTGEDKTMGAKFIVK